ncbi:hypothetical protein CYMTET_52455, partial [Cymbomonas tetramitiformis]
GVEPVRGEGHNKSQAEKACAAAACDILSANGTLHASGTGKHGEMMMAPREMQPPCITIPPACVAEVEEVLQRYHAESLAVNPAVDTGRVTDAGGPSTSYIHFSRNPATTVLESEMFRAEAARRQQASSMREMLQKRAQLPASRFRHEVLSKIRSNAVTVITGETGCGKTTQVPQFILEDMEERSEGAQCVIMVTQPRRIAAISTAERVAQERGESIGQSVGYQVRLDKREPRRFGSILFQTTGILLRKIAAVQGEGQEILGAVSHLVIDEVHERDLDTDFLLCQIRNLMRSGRVPNLRLVLMSATVDSHLFSDYFDRAPSIHIPGFMHPVQEHYLERLPELLAPRCPPHLTRMLQNPKILEEETVDCPLVAITVLSLSERFQEDGGGGSILVFLPGWDTISGVSDELARIAGQAHPRLQVLPLHSQLPAGEQKAVFARPPPSTRKVVLATNIAETSITIDDVVYVVDAGRVKERTHDTARDMTVMKTQWVSQASAKQRRGRAGRVQAGHVVRLFPEWVLHRMEPHTKPEMHRVPLAEAALQIAALRSGVGASLASHHTYGRKFIESFLEQSLQPPDFQAVALAVSSLQHLGALNLDESLTALGTTLTKLPVTPRLGKMLVLGSIFGCCQEMLTVAAAACVREPFVCPKDKREEADRTRAAFAVEESAGSDHLALVTAYKQWLQQELQGRGHEFCQRNFLAGGTMVMIQRLRLQLERTLQEAGFETSSPPIGGASAMQAARAVLGAGLLPNVGHTDMMRESK